MLLLLAAFAGFVKAADTPISAPILSTVNFTPKYYWQVTPVSEGAELLTLYGHFGAQRGDDDGQGVPLVAVLRDSLPDADQNTDRLRYVWLLTAERPRFTQRLLSAVPFLYWHPGLKNHGDVKKAPKALVDLSQPTPRVWRSVGHNILQWTALDPFSMPVRASTRAYRSNGSEGERAHVDEAIQFLRNAPTGDDAASLSPRELDGVIARLTLTKTLLGGLVTENRLEQIAAGRDMQRSETIGRNWELLRTSAERSGLLFEPLQLVDSSEQYAVLWYPLGTTFATPGVSLSKTWKLLHISNPWDDKRLKAWKGYQKTGWLDANGRLLPEGTRSEREVQLVPLSVYSLTYPRSPLLMVDFRNTLTTKRREIAQRGSSELVSGILGLSHFGNWYYFTGNAAYQFIRSRQGGAEDRAERLDSYSEFRVAIALSTNLDPAFAGELRRRVDALNVNPLEIRPKEIEALARRNFEALESSAQNEEKLPERLDSDRRQELANFGAGGWSRAANTMFHYLTLGTYTHRAPKSDDNLSQLARNRKMEYSLEYLSRAVAAGPRPEVTLPAETIQSSIHDLAELVNPETPSALRSRALTLIAAVQKTTRESSLLADCDRALNSLRLTLPKGNEPGKQQPAPIESAQNPDTSGAFNTK